MSASGARPLLRSGVTRDAGEESQDDQPDPDLAREDDVEDLVDRDVARARERDGDGSRGEEERELEAAALVEEAPGQVDDADDDDRLRDDRSRSDRRQESE